MIAGCCRLGEATAVKVFDAQSNQPISGATVRVIYPHPTFGDYVPYPVPFRQCDSEAVTGGDGIAKVKVRGSGYQWQISAPGYTEDYLRRPIPDIEYTEHVFKARVFDEGALETKSVDGKKVLMAPLKRLESTASP